MGKSELISPQIRRIAEVEEKQPLISRDNFFHLTTAKIWSAEYILGEISRLPMAYTAAREKMLDVFIPLTDIITQPRSVNELQFLKKELLQFFHDKANRTGSWAETKEATQQKLDEIGEWLLLFTTSTGFFHYLPKPIHEEPPEKFWQMYETVSSHEFRTIDQKIKGIDEVAATAERLLEYNETRVGLTLGKFRFGAQKGHCQHLERAKIALGNRGLLTVGVESQASINSRVKTEQKEPGMESLYSNPDQERLESIAALEAVDLVFLMDPDEMSLSNYQSHCQYFDNVWRQIKPNFFFFGNPDHPLRNRFENIANQIGVFLFWTSETKSSDTTSLIRKIRQETF